VGIVNSELCVNELARPNISRPNGWSKTSKSTPAGLPNTLSNPKRYASPRIDLTWGYKNVASGSAPLVTMVQSPDLRYRHYWAQLRRL
jgi:hypothetical protein